MNNLIANIYTNYIKPESESCFPFAINILVFVLYVMCFVSLYKPHLELIGYGLFFALHIIMSIGMGLNMTKTVLNPTMDLKIDWRIFKFIWDFKNYIVWPEGTLWEKLFKYFSIIIVIITIILIILLGTESYQIYLGFIVLTMLLFIISIWYKPDSFFGLGFMLWDLFVFVGFLIMSAGSLVYLFLIILQPLIKFKLWDGQSSIKIPIIISLLFLFISFIMLLHTFVSLHAKHEDLNAPTMPTFLKGGNGEVKSGYTFKQNGPHDTGYYLNTGSGIGGSGSGVNFFFNNKETQHTVILFRHIAIAETVLIWVQYFIYTNYNKIMENSQLLGIFAPKLLKYLIICNSIVIVILSSVCIRLTQQIAARTNSIKTSPQKKITSKPPKIPDKTASNQYN